MENVPLHVSWKILLRSQSQCIQLWKFHGGKFAYSTWLWDIYVSHVNIFDVMFLWFAYLTKYFPTIQSFQLFLILIGDDRLWLIHRNLYFGNWSTCLWPLFCPCCWWCKVSLFVEFRFKYLLRIRAVDIPAGVPSKVCRANFESYDIIYIIDIYMLKSWHFYVYWE